MNNAIVATLLKQLPANNSLLDSEPLLSSQRTLSTGSDFFFFRQFDEKDTISAKSRVCDIVDNEDENRELYSLLVETSFHNQDGVLVARENATFIKQRFGTMQSEGLADTARQRGVLGNLLANYVTEWIGPEATLQRLQWKSVKNITPEQQLVCQAAIIDTTSAKNSRQIRCSLKVLDTSEEEIASGEAHLRIPLQ